MVALYVCILLAFPSYILQYPSVLRPFCYTFSLRILWGAHVSAVALATFPPTSFIFATGFDFIPISSSFSFSGYIGSFHFGAGRLSFACFYACME